MICVEVLQDFVEMYRVKINPNSMEAIGIKLKRTHTWERQILEISLWCPVDKTGNFRLSSPVYVSSFVSGRVFGYEFD